MQTFQAIELRRPRDFNRKMNATFEFLRQNFKQLSKSILLIAGPPILVASILMGTMFGDFFSMATLGQNALRDSILTVNFWSQVLLLMLFFLVSAVSTIATINNYIVLYHEKKTNQIEVSEVWERVRSTFWMYLATTFLFTLLAIVVYIAMLIPMGVMAAISPMLIFLAVIGCGCAIIWLFVSSSLVFTIRAFEDIGFMEAMARSFNLVRGKWWSTFGLITLLYIIVMFVSYFMMMAWSMISVTTMLHDTSAPTADQAESIQIFTVVFFSVYYLVQMILYSLPNVGIAFQYFNLVERKEATSLMNQIQTIGDAPVETPDSGNEQY